MSASLQVVWLTKKESLAQTKCEILNMELTLRQYESTPRTHGLMVRYLNRLKSNVAVWENVQ